MYRIIGADQKEYGPVLADQVRKWIVEGRADARTRARSEGGGDWKSLSDFPEFTAALADRKPGAQPGPPRIGAVEADRLAADIIARDYRVDIGECFSRSWNLRTTGTDPRNLRSMARQLRLPSFHRPKL